MSKKFAIFVTILALSAMACGFNVNVPQKKEPGPDVTDKISVDYPKGDDAQLKFSFGAGELKLSPGGSRLVEGTATYNYDELKPEIVEDGGNIQIKVGDSESTFIPSFDNIKNEWDFKLGDKPIDLHIDAGAYEGTYEFGGLSLASLDINDGAASVELSFSEPNQAEMSVFNYSTGASNVKMSGLANANFKLLDLSAGAGDYTLDFSGDLQQDATINIEAGLSNMIIIVPDGVNAFVSVKGGALNITAGSGWGQNGRVYEQEGEGPTLTFVVQMSAGNLTLTH